MFGFVFALIAMAAMAAWASQPRPIPARFGRVSNAQLAIDCANAVAANNMERSR